MTNIMQNNTYCLEDFAMLVVFRVLLWMLQLRLISGSFLLQEFCSASSFDERRSFVSDSFVWIQNTKHADDAWDEEILNLLTVCTVHV